MLTGKDGFNRGVELEVADKGQRKTLQRPIQLLYSLELADQTEREKAENLVTEADRREIVESELNNEGKDAEVKDRDRPRRAAAKDADWRRRELLKDQTS